MDHAARVRELDREADIGERAQDPILRATVGEPMRERAAGDALHREVRTVFLVHVERVDRDDRRMIEPRLDARLSQEPRQRLARGLRAHALDRDLATDP